MKKILPIMMIASLAVVFLSIPAVSAAQTQSTGLVPCGDRVDAGGKVTNPCGFGDAVKIIGNIINYLIIIGSVAAAVAFMYAGFIYLTSGGDTGKVGKAKDIFLKVLLGYIIMLSAWVIVKTIEKTLRPAGSTTFLQQ